MKKSDCGFDFIQALKQSSLTGVFIGICLFLTSTVSAAVAVHSETDTYRFFVSYDMTSILVMLFLLCAGLGTALLLFGFLFDKTRLNILLSAGLSRFQLFKNRCLAGMLAAALGIGLPLTMTLLINILACGGAAAPAFCSFFLYAVTMFAVFFVGFAAGVFCSVLTGSGGDAFFTGTALLFLPMLLILFCDMCFRIFLKGYLFDEHMLMGSVLLLGYLEFAIISPLLMKLCFLNPFLLFFDPSPIAAENGTYLLWVEYARPSSLPVHAGELLRLTGERCAASCGWILLSLLLLFAAYLSFNRHKAEIAGTRGKSPTAAAIKITAFTLFTAQVWLAEGLSIARYDFGAMQASYFTLSESDRHLIFESLLIPALITLFICLLVRMIRTTRSPRTLCFLPLVLLLLLVPACCFWCNFGFVSRVPEVADIEKVSMTVPDSPANGHTYKADFKNTVGFSSQVFTSDRDKAVVTALHTLLAADSSNTDRCDKSQQVIGPSITISYFLKDGTTLSRRYATYSDETYRALFSLFDTDSSEALTVDRLSKKNLWTEDTTDEESVFMAIPFDEYNFYEPTLLKWGWLYYRNVNVSLLAPDGCGSSDITKKLTAKTYTALMAAVAADYGDMTEDAYYTPTEPPVTTVVIAYPKKDENSNVLHTLPVYASMSRTLTLLEELNTALPKAQAGNIVKIALYDCTVPVRYRFYPEALPTNWNNDYDSINIVNGAALVAALEGKESVSPVKTVTDRTEIAALSDKLLPDFLTLGQNVFYAVVTYKNGGESVYIIRK